MSFGDTEGEEFVRVKDRVMGCEKNAIIVSLPIADNFGGTMK